MNFEYYKFFPLFICTGLIFAAAFTLAILWLCSCYYYNLSCTTGWTFHPKETDVAALDTVSSILKHGVPAKNLIKVNLLHLSEHARLAWWWMMIMGAAVFTFHLFYLLPVPTKVLNLQIIIIIIDYCSSMSQNILQWPSEFKMFSKFQYIVLLCSRLW